jgi:glycosyltransferase involved in cell wall biosynthesis
MKVVFASNHAYPPRQVGGSESSTHDLCLTLGERGIDVSVLCSSLPPSIGLGTRLRASLHRSHSYTCDETLGYPVFRVRKPAYAARELARELRPDVAVIMAGRPLALSDRLTASGVPCAVYLRDSFFTDLGGAVRAGPDVRYLATSRHLASRFADEFDILPADIPPIVRRERYQVRPKRNNVTFVCPFPVKGVDIALRLAARRPDIPFVFVESWEVHPVQRIALTRSIRASPNITYRRATGDMRSVYRDAKLVLVPSRWPEGWGRVVSEAQVSGIPALTSNRGGLPESVGSGGILVDPDAGIEEWEGALARMWDDGTEYDRLAQLAREHAHRADFEVAAIATKLLAVLSDLSREARDKHRRGAAPAHAS